MTTSSCCKPLVWALPFLLYLLTIGATSRADELERITAVAGGGATGLALRLLDQQQPSLKDQERWVQWERFRLSMLADKQRWGEITKRVDQLPANLPKEFMQWALLQAANAALAAEDGALARRYLRWLIWDGPAEVIQFGQWRRLVIRSYLLDNDIADAETALRRYQQDYRANNDAWQLLHAKVLLRAGRNKAALDVLSETQSIEGKVLRALAGLRSGIYKPPAVKAQGLQLAERTAARPELQQQAWALVAEASARAADDVYRVIGLEQAIALSGKDTLRESGFTLTADDLWQAYEWLAETLGNRMKLLIGNDQAWFQQAKYYESEEKAYARAFYAFLSRRAAEPALQLDAHKRLSDSLFADGHSDVVQWLYTRSKRFESLATIPAAIRHRLADLALKRRDIHMAAQLLQGLDDPPAGEDRDQWSLRRARVLIYASDFKNGALVLSQILDNKRSLDPAFADRYVQVLFDLQAVGSHAEAYVLLDSVFALVDKPQQRRELLFWMADSQAALGDFQKASELYLRSALYGADKGSDPWGHSARFHAAEALAKAGLVADARAVYSKLLAETGDPRRQALIERNIQQLWLREQQASQR